MTSAPRAGAHTESRFGRKHQLKSTGSVALHFRENATPHQTKSMTYATSTRANCRRWAKGCAVRVTDTDNKELCRSRSCAQTGFKAQAKRYVILPDGSHT